MSFSAKKDISFLSLMHFHVVLSFQSYKWVKLCKYFDGRQR